MISEEQLKTWSNQGGTANSIAAHTSIRNALEANDSPLNGRKFEVFLQGSYRNSTNIRGDSDVDVVVQTNEVFYKDLSRLLPEQRAAQERSFRDGAYNAPEWRAEVEKALRKKFGSALRQGGGKAFYVVTGPGNMTADVLPAVRFKRYTSFSSPQNERFDEGVQFVDTAGSKIVNFPKLHIKNGEAKNSANQTNGRYKPAVRMFKNARNCLIDRRTIRDGLAPSYFVECLLYNVPSDRYSGTFQETYYRVVEYLLANDIAEFMCQNGVLRLFGTASTQWNMDNATGFALGLGSLWDNW